MGSGCNGVPCIWFVVKKDGNHVDASARGIESSDFSEYIAEKIRYMIAAALNKLCNCADGCQCCNQAEPAANCTCNNCGCLKCRVCTASDGISTGISKACDGLTNGIKEVCQSVCRRIDNVREKWTQAFSGAATKMGTDCNTITFNQDCESVKSAIKCSSSCRFNTTGCPGNGCQTQNECTDCESAINGADCTGCDNTPDAQINNTSERDKIKNEITKLLAGYAQSAVVSVCVYAKVAAKDLKAACTEAKEINTQLTELIDSNSFSNLGGEFYKQAKEIPDTENSPEETILHIV